MKTKVGYLSCQGGDHLDRATVRLETISSFVFGPKMALASPTLVRISPLPWPTLLGFYWAKSLAPLLAGHCMVLGHIQQIRCRSNFAISSKPHQGYKVSYCLAYSDTSTRFLQHAVVPP